MAINNATVYGVQDKIHFINMNLLKLQSADFDVNNYYIIRKK